MADAELVLTTPPAYSARLYGRQMRTTMGVLTQLMVEASARVVLAAPFMQPRAGLGEGPLSVAATAALRRGVDVFIVGTSEGLATIQPGALTEGARGTLRTYLPAPNAVDPTRLGSHAKFCVADGRAAYIGSANFTGPGLGTQLELGVLVRGHAARLVDDFWELAREVGFFELRDVYPPASR